MSVQSIGRLVIRKDGGVGENGLMKVMGRKGVRKRFAIFSSDYENFMRVKKLPSPKQIKTFQKMGVIHKGILKLQ